MDTTSIDAKIEEVIKAKEVYLARQFKDYTLKSTDLYAVFHDASFEKYSSAKKAIEQNPQYLILKIKGFYPGVQRTEWVTTIITMDTNIESSPIRVRKWEGKYIRVNTNFPYRNQISTKVEIADPTGLIKEANMEGKGVSGIIDLHKCLLKYSEFNSWKEVDLQYELDFLRLKFGLSELKVAWEKVLMKELEEARKILLDVQEEINKTNTFDNLPISSENTVLPIHSQHFNFFEPKEELVKELEIKNGHQYLIAGDIEKAVNYYRFPKPHKKGAWMPALDPKVGEALKKDFPILRERGFSLEYEQVLESLSLDAKEIFDGSN